MLMRLVLLLFLLLPQAVVFAQQMQFDNISSSMQLPSQECYAVKQDSKGYIWFSTEQGLCRYNGEKLLVYNEKNGLPEKAVYGIAEDSLGKMWIVTTAGRVLYIERGKLREAPFSHNIQRLAGEYIPAGLQFISGQRLCITMLNYRNLVVDLRTNAITENMLIENLNDYRVNLVGNKLIGWNGRSVRFPKTKPWARITLNVHEEGRFKKSIRLPSEEISVRSSFLLTLSSGKRHYVAIGQYLVALNPGGTETIHRLPGRILSMYCDRQGGLWVGTLLKGVFYYDQARLSARPVNSLSDFSVSGIMQDTENNIWCTTLEKGLFFCRNKKVLSHAIGNIQQNPEIMTYLDHTVFAGWREKIFALTDDTVRQFALKVWREEHITDMELFNGKYYIASNGFFIEADKNFTRLKNVRLSVWPHISSCRQLLVKNGILYTLGNGSVGEVIDGTWNIYPTKEPIPIGHCFTPLAPDTFLYGTRKGVLIMVKQGNKCAPLPLPGIRQSVSSIFTDRSGRIFICTKGEGLYEYRNKKLEPVNDRFRLPAKILFEMGQDSFGRYWITSSTGLFCCVPRGDSIQTFSYTVYDGLPATETYRLAITPDRVFFSTIYGISSLPLQGELKSTADPKIYLSDLRVNNRSMGSENLPAQFPHTQNTLRFSFDVLSFKNNQHHIVYRLNGRDEKFVHENTTELVMENLSPGTYALVVYAQNENGTRSKRPFVYHFYIAAPFWQTWWFIALMAVLLIVICVFILRYFIQRAQKRDEEKNRINAMLAESQLTAIQAQMNPHFVFNAINSIQNYILKNQKEEAYGYLAKFSHLIRMVLNHSQKKLIPLQKELEILALYVELEQLRFKQVFDFEVQVHESIDELEVLLLPMLIQPLLENAIWHGLMPLEKSKTGKLSLSFSMEKKQLKIVVLDNGIGREAARKNKMNVDHHSMAMGLVKARIKMARQLYQAMDDAYMHIIDLFDENGLAAGTRVEIYLPVL